MKADAIGSRSFVPGGGAKAAEKAEKAEKAGFDAALASADQEEAPASVPADVAKEREEHDSEDAPSPDARMLAGEAYRAPPVLPPIETLDVPPVEIASAEGGAAPAAGTAATTQVGFALDGGLAQDAAGPAEASKPEAPKPEGAIAKKPEGAIANAKAPEGSRAAAPKVDVPKKAAPKPDGAKAEAPKPETMNAAPAEPARPPVAERMEAQAKKAAATAAKEEDAPKPIEDAFARPIDVPLPPPEAPKPEAPRKVDASATAAEKLASSPAQRDEAPKAVHAAEATAHKRALREEAHGRIVVPELGQIDVRARVEDKTKTVQVHVHAEELHARQVLAVNAEDLRAHVRVEVPNAEVHTQLASDGGAGNPWRSDGAGNQTSGGQGGSGSGGRGGSTAGDGEAARKDPQLPSRALGRIRLVL